MAKTLSVDLAGDRRLTRTHGDASQYSHPLNFITLSHQWTWIGVGRAGNDGHYNY